MKQMMMLSLLLLVGACDKKSSTEAGEPVVASCDATDRLGVCTEYAAAAVNDDVKNDCAMTGGAWAAKACSSSRLLGTCALAGGRTSRKYYAKGRIPFTESSAANNCAKISKGKWTPR